jgi:glycine cleavage system H protein
LFSADNYRFAKSHEWIALESDNTATVGISDHAQDALGEAVYVDLPDVGDELQQGDVFGVVESVKAAADLYSPVGGEVTEVNKDLTDSPSIINEDPYNAGWIMKLKIKDNAEFDSLMTAEEYEKFLTEDN